MSYTPEEATRALIAACVFDDPNSVAAIVRDVVTSAPDAISAVLTNLTVLATRGFIDAARTEGTEPAEYLARHCAAAARHAEADVS